MTHYDQMRALLDAQRCEYIAIDPHSGDWSDWLCICRGNKRAGLGLRVGNGCFLYYARGSYLGYADMDNTWIPRHARGKR